MEHDTIEPLSELSQEMSDRRNFRVPEVFEDRRELVGLAFEDVLPADAAVLQLR